MSPDLGGTIPQMDINVVVFPAPFAPIRVIISPSETLMLTSFKA
jgi:hypothetical protein